MTFRHIVDFKYKDQSYQAYLSEDNYKYAFLKQSENGNLTYPSLEEITELAQIWSQRRNVYALRDDTKTRVKFLPKVKLQGALVLLTASLLTTGCSAVGNNSFNVTTNKLNTSSTTTTTTTSPTTSPKVEESDKKEATITIDYEKLLAAADDDLDYKYASDYKHYLKTHRFRDTKGIHEIFNIGEITVKDIEKVLNDNKDIDKKYKDFIINYVKDWEKLYPGTDFITLYTNLKTMRIFEVDKATMQKKTYSSDTVASYILSENAIYVADDIDISKESDGYIVLTHELTHAAKIFDIKDSDGNKYFATFDDISAIGTYTEEGLATIFAYQMQGLNNKSSQYYILLSNYFTIIQDVIDYDGADFINHSVNELITKMNEYTGTDQGAYILAQIEAQATLKFTPYAQVAYTEFSDLYDYMVNLYMSKYLHEGMSYNEALKVFDTFYYDGICYGYKNIYKSYEITPECFMPGFEESLKKFGIEKQKELEVESSEETETIESENTSKVSR